MSIRLNLTNRNKNYDSLVIYRSTSKIDLANLPAPLVTLVNKEQSYLDTTAPKNTLVYYAFAVKRGSEVTYSVSRPAVNAGYTGPGPQELVLGDWRFGYFGSMPAAELFTAVELCAAFGIASPYTNGSLTWHKFAFKGKVLYFPTTHLSTAVGWNRLYAFGLVFGVDGPGPSGHGNAPTNQLRKVKKGDDELIVRLPRSNNTPDYTHGTVNVTDGLDVAEYALVYSARAVDTGAPNTTLNNITSSMVNASYVSPMAEFQAGAITLGCNHMAVNTWAVTATAPANCPRNATNHLWRPVLEYVFT